MYIDLWKLKLATVVYKIRHISVCTFSVPGEISFPSHHPFSSAGTSGFLNRAQCINVIEFVIVISFLDDCNTTFQNTL